MHDKAKDMLCTMKLIKIVMKYRTHRVKHTKTTESLIEARLGGEAGKLFVSTEKLALILSESYLHRLSGTEEKVSE